MADIIIKTLVSFFAIYGLMGFVKEVVEFFFSPKRKYDELVVVVKVLNSEETLEATIRMILWKCMSARHGGFTPNILIVDMGSDDSTPEIAKKLCKDYGFVRYTTADVYNKAKGMN